MAAGLRSLHVRTGALLFPIQDTILEVTNSPRCSPVPQAPECFPIDASDDDTNGESENEYCSQRADDDPN